MSGSSISFPDASHLVISVGGNDASGHGCVLDESVRPMADALDRLDGIRDQFAQDYAPMLNRLLGGSLPWPRCTTYHPRFPDPTRQRLAPTGLTVFNYCIIREAFERGMALIYLRLICDRDEDFSTMVGMLHAAA